MKRERLGRFICTATGKRRYASYFEAKAVARAITDSTGEDHGHAYRCDDCDGWHLGRPSVSKL